MRIPRSASSSLVVALVALALLQLDAYRLRRDFERSIVSRQPFASEVAIVLPSPGDYRLVLQGDASAAGVPRKIAYTEIRSESAPEWFGRWEGPDAERGVRQRSDHRVPLVTLEHMAAGRYSVRLATEPPVSAHGAVRKTNELLVLRGKRATAPSPWGTLALTTVLVLSLLVAGVGIARGMRDGV